MVSSLIVFFLLRRFHREKDYSCVKNIDGALKSSKSQRPAKAGLSVFPEILAELLLVRDISSNIHVEIAEFIKVNMLFHRSLLSTDVTSHRKGSVSNLIIFFAESSYVYVQHITGSKNRDDMSIENKICSTVIQKK